MLVYAVGALTGAGDGAGRQVGAGEPEPESLARRERPQVNRLAWSTSRTVAE